MTLSLALLTGASIAFVCSQVLLRQLVRESGTLVIHTCILSHTKPSEALRSATA